MIEENLQAVWRRISSAAEKAGRTKEGITLVAVTKTVDIERIEEAIVLGVKDIGENRIQEALPKFERIGDKARWHMVGHLQTNKARAAVKIFDLIHSVESLHLAESIDKEAKKIDKVQKILVEVNISKEESKYGVTPKDAPSLIAQMTVLDNIRISGLMAMAPIVDNPEDARPYFRELRALSERINSKKILGVEMQWLSMGMSQDYEVAIEEGANMVRIGTAIFKGRKCCHEKI